MVPLLESVTLLASFDGGVDADFARGDARLFTAPSYRKQGEARPGLGNPDVTHLSSGGWRGGALQFRKKNRHAIFYKAKDNIATDGRSLACTVSFWLNLDPDQDLAPGYCDPIQITDRSYNDSALWVDFTKDETPRHFRLGVFGDLKAWNPENLPPAKNPTFTDRLVVVKKPPFTRGTWHQVTMVVATPIGRAWLYLDGELQGESRGIDEVFSWELDRATIRLGMNYVGLFDELTVFDRALTADEVRVLYNAGQVRVRSTAL